MATMARFLCILTNSDNQTAVFLNVETLENETDYLDALAIALEANPECQYGVALPAEAHTIAPKPVARAVCADGVARFWQSYLR